jgi:hypothetical protein
MTTATESQIRFYNSLLDEISRLTDQFSLDAIRVARDTFPGQSKSEASESIARAMRTRDRLKSTQKPLEAPQTAAKPTKSHPPVLDGNYALVNAEGVLRFYSVQTPTEGKWRGFTFVTVNASDERHAMKGTNRIDILNRIAADPVAASAAYGHHFRRCGVCSRQLTDELSRARGIGPECYKKFAQ